MNNYIFALDIGTRSVVGVLLKKDPDRQDQYQFVDLACVEHKERAMLNGQIHNAPLVSKVVAQVRTMLEERHQIKLEKTSVAAAGRALLTHRETFEELFPEEKVVTKEDAARVTLSCVYKAQHAVKQQQADQSSSQYYCVGYSLIRNYLDDIELGNLEGQRGSKISVEIVAAFLPKMVLESLKYVIEDNQLSLSSVTLEPIAAINAIIPATMRKLNLVLVDIGAGTSDIAISSDGVIHAYGMVPLAGDEITEKLSSDFLLDFNEADRVKRVIAHSDHVEYQDVLGFTQYTDRESMLSALEPAVHHLASEITTNILTLNGKPPQAVLLIGGGSLTPGIDKKIASLLELPENRVAVQKAKSIPDLTGLPDEFSGPEFITPIGIALTDKNESNLGFIEVLVNQQKVSVLNLGQNTVFDALLSAGISPDKIYGKPGISKTVKVNGKVKIIPGSPGKESVIKINDTTVTVNHPVQDSDEIIFTPGESGIEGLATVRDFMDAPQFILFNGQKVKIPVEIIVDNRMTDQLDLELRDNANLTIRPLHTLAEFLEKKNKEYLKSITFTLGINQNSTFKSLYLYDYFINDIKVAPDAVLKSGDRLNVIEKDKQLFTVSHLMSNILNSLEKKAITVYLDDRQIDIPVADFEIYHNEQIADRQAVINNDDIIYVKRTELKKPMLIDLFKEINYTPKAPEGKTKVEILLNGQDAEYTSPIADGDRIQIIWR